MSGDPQTRRHRWFRPLWKTWFPLSFLVETGWNMMKLELILLGFSWFSCKFLEVYAYPVNYSSSTIIANKGGECLSISSSEISRAGAFLEMRPQRLGIRCQRRVFLWQPRSKAKFGHWNQWCWNVKEPSVLSTKEETLHDLSADVFSCFFFFFDDSPAMPPNYRCSRNRVWSDPGKSWTPPFLGLGEENKGCRPADQGPFPICLGCRANAKSLCG